MTPVKYKVHANHRFHANKIGTLEFIGGSEKDVLVLCIGKEAGLKIIICVDPNDAEIYFD